MFAPGGACMVLFGGCMVLFGGHAWFYLGGVRGFILGACMVLFGGGMCVFFSFFGYNEIWSMNGRYASYWNAFLLTNNFAKNCMKMKKNGLTGDLVSPRSATMFYYLLLSYVLCLNLFYNVFVDAELCDMRVEA